MLKELRQKQVEELLKLDIDPFDSVFNAAPSCEGNNKECVNFVVLQHSFFSTEIFFCFFFPGYRWKWIEISMS